MPGPVRKEKRIDTRVNSLCTTASSPQEKPSATKEIGDVCTQASVTELKSDIRWDHINSLVVWNFLSVQILGDLCDVIDFFYNSTFIETNSKLLYNDYNTVIKITKMQCLHMTDVFSRF